ncbi:hypothetical protein ACFE04_029269 [Oxalis oulophora]
MKSKREESSRTTTTTVNEEDNGNESLKRQKKSEPPAVALPLAYDDDDENDDDDESNQESHTHRVVQVRRDCPYLDTVNRQWLDFDFERFCSVSMSNLNVYACLVCGKYFQGRGNKSHAYTHSLEAGHHVYINLRTEKVYCLPDGYEINDPSLDDIRHVLNPRFTTQQIQQLDKNKQWSRTLDGSDYLPGMVGLNNISNTDFVNVTIQSLMRVTPLRNFFLIPDNYQHSKSPLVHQFGELTRKIWHSRNFKGQVSPHEFLQAVMKASKKKFRIGAQSDPVEFMAWLLNTLHADLRTSKKDTSIISKCFQGELEVVKEVPNKALIEKKENGEGQNTDGVSKRSIFVSETKRSPFLMLGLDLPPPPLFKDVMEKNIIPQVHMSAILKKFDGETITEVVRPHVARMRYRVTRLPQYLIFHMRRFTKNNFFMEKNPTLVTFPVKNLELKDYMPLPTPKENEKLRSKYDLIANIVHDGKPAEGYYRAFVQRKSEELWYEIQDLHVSETLPHMKKHDLLRHVAVAVVVLKYKGLTAKDQLKVFPCIVVGVSKTEYLKIEEEEEARPNKYGRRNLQLDAAVVSAVARALLGLDLEPQFDEPYLSTSLQDFWGRRWNLMVTSILRPTVYDPVLNFSSRLIGRKWAPLPAVLGTFIVSALMHELIFYHFGRVRPTWEISLFFLLHGVCLTAEIALKKALKGRSWQLPRPIAIVLTIGFVMVTGVSLFFPQIIRCRAIERALHEYAALGAFVKNGVGLLTTRSFN